jgi:hypothetical protein
MRGEIYCRESPLFAIELSRLCVPKRSTLKLSYVPLHEWLLEILNGKVTASLFQLHTVLNDKQFHSMAAFKPNCLLTSFAWICLFNFLTKQNTALTTTLPSSFSIFRQQSAFFGVFISLKGLRGLE